MGEYSNIEWTEATWNPWHGCHKVSAGCKNCYMFRDKARYGDDPNVVVRSKTKFHDPLKWKEPRTITSTALSARSSLRFADIALKKILRSEPGAIATG